MLTFNTHNTMQTHLGKLTGTYHQLDKTVARIQFWPQIPAHEKKQQHELELSERI